MYRRVAVNRFVIAAIGPEAKHDSRGFDRTIAAAEARLEEIGAGGQGQT